MAALGDWQLRKYQPEPEVYPGHALHVISVMDVLDDKQYQFVQPELTNDAVSRGEQAVAPALLYVFVEHAVAIPLIQKEPAGHVETDKQVEAPVPENVLAAQAVALPLTQKEPAGHVKQAEAPTVE